MPLLTRQARLALIAISSCLASGQAAAAPVSLTELAPGDLQITEYMANPATVGDGGNEYFELFNQRDQAVDLNGLLVRDDGSNQFVIDSAVIPARGFLVLSNGDGSGLGFVPDYLYGGSMALTNTSDEIRLLGPGDRLLQSLSYDDGDAFGAGVAHELLFGDRSGSESFGPRSGTDYGAATAALAAGNLGSPGAPGTTAFSAPIVPVPPAIWLFATALAGLSLLRRRSLAAA